MWLMGWLCCETKEFFAVEVDKWDKDSLSAIVKEKVHQESTMINNWQKPQHPEANHELHQCRP